VIIILFNYFKVESSVKNLFKCVNVERVRPFFFFERKRDERECVLEGIIFLREFGFSFFFSGDSGSLKMLSCSCYFFLNVCVLDAVRGHGFLLSFLGVCFSLFWFFKIECLVFFFMLILSN
jgi:hypothetical protein